MPEVKNPEYRFFLETGLINVMTPDEFDNLLMVAEANPPPQANREQVRALLIMLFYSGRRPSEIIELKSGDFSKEGSYLKVVFRTKKKGAGTILYFPLRNKHIKEVWEYVKNLPPEMYVFWYFRGESRKGKYKDTTYKVRYWVQKWSRLIGKELVPYFFRHHRLSVLAMKGASPEELKFWKGAKTLDSVAPYLHLSQKQAKKLARLIE